MHIISTNCLTSNQYHDAKSLIELCKEADNSSGISFLDAEMNYIRDFQCFYMLYGGNTLISFLSIFVIDENTCEIYGNTLPSSRGMGYFKKLLDEAVITIKEYNISNAYLVNEPVCQSGKQFIQSVNAVYYDSDYLMVYDTAITPQPRGILELKSEKDGCTETFETFRAGEPIGICHVEYTKDHAVIYGFEVYEQYRGRGYGTETLLLVLKYLLDDQISQIRLHVTHANTAAHHMYKHHGFFHKEQLDYWKLVL